ncbi:MULTISPECIES: hypothetical protein [Chryseobacterium]|uniref:RteC protein n=1 Tax=Chryseobacterium geocarposphaerae TaxID=1416776 RepID=A0ABU1LH05_9FLAO|nr:MULTISPECIES: hypothetical protein [Chryseobacterium]MDR6405860.1 hypothetical protein [Chryseobacterium geocarposphaerae]MDR6698976.1 hypothetical protein [Chryseobacterium ginsenosidimutans]
MYSNKRLIIKNKIKSLIYFIEEITIRKDTYKSNNKVGSEEEFLNSLLVEVDIEITQCYKYALNNEINNIVFDQFKIQFSNLVKLFKGIESEILQKGFTVNDEYLKFYRDIDILLTEDELHTTYISEKEQRYFELKNIFCNLIGENIKIKNNTISKSYTDYLWFKVGIKLANGEIYQLINKYGNNASRISKEINLKEAEKFILASINNYSGENTNKGKNIFNYPDKIEKVIDYCQENDISISNDFLQKIKNK